MNTDALEAGYTDREIALARQTVGEDALAGIGYERDYQVALRAVHITYVYLNRNEAM